MRPALAGALFTLSATAGGVPPRTVLGGITVVRPVFERAVTEEERSKPEARPPLRGFFPPLGQGIDPAGAWRAAAWELSPATGDPERLRAAEHVARRLAVDGLVTTVAQVLAGRPARTADPDWLAAIGIPLDWLRCFSPPPDPRGGRTADRDLLAWLSARLGEGASAAELAPDLQRCVFRFEPSSPGFRVAEDSGGTRIGAFRLQIPAGGYWQAREDGSGADLARGLCEALPDVPVFAAVEAKHADALATLAREWALGTRTGAIVLLAQDLPVSQWAQDSARSGIAEGAVVTLVPRYASRGEEASGWVPGEMRALEAFATQGQAVVRSPLLFQGGNLLVVRDPGRAERVLLAGEAEVYRNAALGLSHEQVLECFRIEFGVDRVLVIPAVSYHVDYEISARTVGNELVCFVNDPRAAALELLRIAVETLAAAKKIDAGPAAAARAALASGNSSALNDSLAQVLFGAMVHPGHFRESFAKVFRVGAGDSHVANFHRVMLALDLLISSDAKERFDDRYVQGFIDAFQRRSASRDELMALLRAQGWRVVPVPSLSEGVRSINYLNGLHADGVYLMPAWGGLFAPLDDRARQAFERELGPAVRVIPILSGESQRRLGAVRCAVSVVPAR